MQAPASSEQARRVTDEEGEEAGDGRTEGSSAIGDRRRAAVSLMPAVDGTDSGSLLDSNLPTPWKNCGAAEQF